MGNLTINNGGIITNSDTISNVDLRYGPYNSIEDANTSLNGHKVLGLTVGIRQRGGGIKEYWYQLNSQTNTLELTQKQADIGIDYNSLDNKPKINNIELDGNISLSELGAATKSEVSELAGKVDKLPTGRYYGQYDSVENLPEYSQLSEKGYAYVSSIEPNVYYIYLYNGDGEAWQDSGNKFVTTNLETNLETKSQTNAPTTKAVAEGIESVDITIQQSYTNNQQETARTNIGAQEDIPEMQDKFPVVAALNDRVAVSAEVDGVSKLRSMGYKVLKAPVEGDSTTSFQEQLAPTVDGTAIPITNTVFEVKDYFDLGGGTFTIPVNSVLKINGGIINNGSLNLNNCQIEGTNGWIGEDLVVSGKVKNEVFADWFRGSDSDMIERAIAVFGNISLYARQYNITRPIIIQRSFSLKGQSIQDNFNTNYNAKGANSTILKAKDSSASDHIDCILDVRGYYSGDDNFVGNDDLHPKHTSKYITGTPASYISASLANIYFEGRWRSDGVWWSTPNGPSRPITITQCSFVNLRHGIDIWTGCSLLTSKPSDWDSGGHTKYYQYDSSIGKYKKLTGTKPTWTTDTYYVRKSTNFSDCLMTQVVMIGNHWGIYARGPHAFSGTNITSCVIEGNHSTLGEGEYDTYTLQTSSTAPSTWNSQWNTRYYKKENNEYIKLSGTKPTYVANTFYYREWSYIDGGGIKCAEDGTYFGSLVIESTLMEGNPIGIYIKGDDLAIRFEKVYFEFISGQKNYIINTNEYRTSFVDLGIEGVTYAERVKFYLTGVEVSFLHFTSPNSQIKFYYNKCKLIGENSIKMKHYLSENTYTYLSPTEDVLNYCKNIERTGICCSWSKNLTDTYLNYSRFAKFSVTSSITTDLLEGGRFLNKGSYRIIFYAAKSYYGIFSLSLKVKGSSTSTKFSPIFREQSLMLYNIPFNLTEDSSIKLTFKLEYTSGNGEAYISNVFIVPDSSTHNTMEYFPLSPKSEMTLEEIQNYPIENWQYFYKGTTSSQYAITYPSTIVRSSELDSKIYIRNRYLLGTKYYENNVSSNSSKIIQNTFETTSPSVIIFSQANVENVYIELRKHELLLEEPDDWETNYNNYRYKSSNTNYPQINSVAPPFELGKYFERVNDNYILLETSPETWNSNYSNYYSYNTSENIYEPVIGVAPPFELNKYYSRITTYMYPTFGFGTLQYIRGILICDFPSKYDYDVFVIVNANTGGYIAFFYFYYLNSKYDYKVINSSIKPEFSDDTTKKGYQYFDEEKGVPMLYNGHNWRQTIIGNGDNTLRPSLQAEDAGFIYYDTTISKNICWNGTYWTDMMGEPIEIQVSDTSILISAAADSSATINIYHENTLNVSALNPDNTPATWLTVPSTIAVGTDSLTITANSANTTNPRGAKVIIEDGTDVVIINVIQNYL